MKVLPITFTAITQTESIHGSLDNIPRDEVTRHYSIIPQLASILLTQLLVSVIASLDELNPLNHPVCHVEM